MPGLIPTLLARRRLGVGAEFVLVTAVLGWRAVTLRIDPGVESMIPTGRGDLDALRTFHARFGSDEVVVLALHADPLFSRESLVEQAMLWSPSIVSRRLAGAVASASGAASV